MIKGAKSTPFKAKLLPFVLCIGICSWLVIVSLYPPLPTAKKPLIFYSNALRDDLKTVILRAIKEARFSIVVQMYGLTDSEILNALLKKKLEGIDVQIFYDKKASQHLPPRLGAYPISSSGLMHRKILIIDEQLAFIGTANFTTPSLKMHGNAVAGFYNPDIAKFFQESIDHEKTFPICQAKLASYLLPDPNHEGLDAVINAIQEACQSIHIAMFTLTHPLIVKNLINAKNRGVDVIVIIDRFTAKGASLKAINQLRKQGVKIKVSRGDQLFHHKWAFIDDQTFLIGSANWTIGAFENNQDCLCVLTHLGPKEVKRLKKLWKAIAIASEKL